MCIQWQMGAVDGQIILKSHFQFAIVRSGDRPQACPKQAVMHDQQIRTLRDGHLKDRLAGIHRRGHLRHRPRIFYLQAIQCIRIVAIVRDAEQGILIIHDFFKLHGRTIPHFPVHWPHPPLLPLRRDELA